LEVVGNAMKGNPEDGSSNPHQVAWRSKDEIGQLVDAYNRMVQQTEENAKALANAEKERAWREMAQQVAHEIKNPLTPMRLMTQLHASRAAQLTADEVRNFSESMLAQIDAMSAVAGDFSELAKISNGPLRPVDLATVLRRIQLAYPGIDLALPAGPWMVLGTEDSLLRVFNNLLNNALDAIPQGKQPNVSVTVREDEGHILVSVRDNGSGIAPERWEAIFAPHFTTKSTGTGLGLALVRRTFTSGEAADTIVRQAAWNIDKMDGSGPSGVTLDPTKTQILAIDLEWLGVGRVRFGFVVDGNIFHVHEMNHANVLAVVYMSTPNLPIRYEISNAGTGGAASLVHICSSVVSEGGQDATVLQTYLSRGGTAATLANADLLTPIMSARLKATHLGTRISPVLVEVLATTSINYEWRLLLNPTVAGEDAADCKDVTNSALQFDIARTATNVLSGGQTLGGGYGSSTAQNKAPISGIASSYLTIGSKIDGTVDQLVLGVMNIDANAGTVYGGIVFDEYN
jgi:two-component sensor histidine kinase